MSNSVDAPEAEDLDAPVIDHSDDDFSDDEPLDVGAAMGQADSEPSPQQDHSDDASDDPEETDYPTLVTNAAHGLHEGYLSWDDIEIPDSLDADQFEADVEQKIGDLEDRHESVQDSSETDDEDNSAPEQSGVNWTALWDEFGFDTEDTHANIYASNTQLVAALECSEQGISGEEGALIRQAVDDGRLHKLTIDGEYGEQIDRGYVLDGGQQ